uniref:HVA22-like protein k isoform X1 n=1 Tax=Rhizophora mucronata TaxID=61149 RepID=A0A2P2KVY1_RHIMU
MEDMGAWHSSHFVSTKKLFLANYTTHYAIRAIKFALGGFSNGRSFILSRRTNCFIHSLFMCSNRTSPGHECSANSFIRSCRTNCFIRHHFSIHKTHNRVNPDLMPQEDWTQAILVQLLCPFNRWELKPQKKCKLHAIIHGKPAQSKMMVKDNHIYESNDQRTSNVEISAYMCLAKK